MTPISPETVAAINQRGCVNAAVVATTGAGDGFNHPLWQCRHVRAQAWDDLFTLPELLLFAETDIPQYLLCQLSDRQLCRVPSP